MKKILVLLFAVLGLALAGCNRQADQGGTGSDSSQGSGTNSNISTNSTPSTAK